MIGSIATNGLAVGVRCRLWNTKLSLNKKIDMENNTSTNHENGNDANRLLVAVPFTELKVGDEILIGENQFDKVDEIDADDYSVVLQELGWNFSPDDDGNYLVRHYH